jgi:AhpD family alkylhydroperoxidase
MTPRIPLITQRDALDAEGRAAFDRIVASRGTMLRPFEVLLHSPEMAAKVAELGHTIRFGSHLRDADRELATLATGRARRCAFVWESHRGAAEAAGVGADAIAELELHGRGSDARGEAIVSFVNELCGDGDVSDATFATVHGLIGTQGVVELALVVGYYTMLGIAMRAVDAC